jgi:hypothetical protein
MYRLKRRTLCIVTAMHSGTYRGRSLETGADVICAPDFTTAA